MIYQEKDLVYYVQYHQVGVRFIFFRTFGKIHKAGNFLNHVMVIWRLLLSGDPVCRVSCLKMSGIPSDLGRI